MISRPVCHQCGGTALLRRQITANGVSQVAWYCMACSAWAEKPARWLAHDAVAAIMVSYHKTVDDLDIVADYRELALACVVCGKPGEYHHWMPQTLARREEVWPDWPHWGRLTVYLCRDHHRLWHRLVTPWMPGVEL